MVQGHTACFKDALGCGILTCDMRIQIGGDWYKHSSAALHVSCSDNCGGAPR